MEKSGMDEREFYIVLLRLLKYVRLVPLDMIGDFEEEAFSIIGGIHENDVVFIATALAFNCGIWSDDKHFKKQDRIKIRTTKDMKKELERK